MITAFVMMNVERDRISAVANELLKIAGVTEVYSVAGDHDLVGIARVKEAEDLARVVTEGFVKVREITRTTTLIAFRCYSDSTLSTCSKSDSRASGT